MKTVQECLREFDMEELLNAYLAIPFIRDEMIEVMKKKDTMMGIEVWNMFRDRIRKYIEYMRSTTVKSSEELSVLYVYEVPEGSLWGRFSHGLVHIAELKEKGTDAEDYSYTLCTHKQVAGFLVADTKLTRDNLLGLMKEVLYEASFYGYTEEEIQEEIQNVETEEFEDDSFEAAFMNYKPKPKSEDEMRLEKACNKAREEYSVFLRKKALLEVIESLQQEHR